MPSPQKHWLPLEGAVRETGQLTGVCVAGRVQILELNGSGVGTRVSALTVYTTMYAHIRECCSMPVPPVSRRMPI